MKFDRGNKDLRRRVRSIAHQCKIIEPSLTHEPFKENRGKFDIFHRPSDKKKSSDAVFSGTFNYFSFGKIDKQ